MTSRWDPDFGVYFEQLDDRPASFVVDLAALGHAPVASHPLRLGVRVAMRVPRADGLRDATEQEALGAAEDQLVDALEASQDAIYVGRVVHDGHTTMYFYLPERLTELPPAGDYATQWAIVEDAGWQLYLEFLAPGPYALQGIWNRRLVEVFRERGDRLEAARELDHVALFPSRDHAVRAAVALAAAGFRTDEPELAEEGDEWSLEFHRDDALAGDRPDEVVAEILDVVLAHDGSYDGWGATLVT